MYQFRRAVRISRYARSSLPASVSRRVASGRLPLAANFRERGAQFVRVSRRLREAGKRILEAVEHFIESDRHRLQLARPLGRRDSFVQVTGSHSSERAGHFTERSQAAFGHGHSDDSGGENAATEHSGDQQPKLSGESSSSTIARPGSVRLAGVGGSVRD